MATCDPDANVAVIKSGFSHRFTLANESCAAYAPSGIGKFNSGMYLTVPFPHTSVHVIDDTFGEYDRGYLAIPDDVLGVEYYVGTYCAFGGICQFAITPVIDNTRVDITFPREVIGSYDCNGVSIQAGETLSFTLNEYEVLHFESPSDLSGVHILANDTVALVAGARNISTRIPDNVGSIMEMLPPVSRWGQKFIVSPNPNNNAGDVIKIVTYADNTKIKITAFSPFVVPVGGTVVEQRVDWEMHSLVETSAPVMLLQITALDMYNVTNAVVGTPSMLVVPSVNQYIKRNNLFHLPCDQYTTIVGISFPNSIWKLFEHIGMSVNVVHNLTEGYDVYSSENYTAYALCGTSTSAFPLAVEWEYEYHVSQ